MLFSIKSNELINSNFNNNIHKISLFRKQDQISESDIEAILEIILEKINPKKKIIGRQVKLSDIQDTIDLLAIDENGNLVVIDAKKDCLLPGTDFQILKYASYVSNWSYTDIKNQTTQYYNQRGISNFNFHVFLDDLLENKTEIELNKKQKMLIIGSGTNKKIFSVINYLKSYNVDINYFKMTFYSHNNSTLFDLIPIFSANEVYSEYQTKPKTHNTGKKYHLQNCTDENIKTIEAFNNAINEIYPDVEGPIWDNSTYVSFRLYGRKLIDYRINNNSFEVTIFSPEKYKKERVDQLIFHSLGYENENIKYKKN